MNYRNGFQPLDEFTTAEYQLLPFRFHRFEDEEYLLVSEAGEYMFLDRPSLVELIQHRLLPDHPARSELEAKLFLKDPRSSLTLDLLATQVRTKKSFLEGFTRLHLFVVTLRCDHSCRYCQVSRVNSDQEKFDMSEETARRSIDLMFHSPAQTLKVEFQGGEPLLNFERIRFIVEEVLERNVEERRQIDFVVTTNLAPLTEEMLDFFAIHGVYLSTSLDGPAELHNANRPRPGRNSYQLVVENLDRARRALGHDRVSAIMTTTQRSLDCPEAIVDEYVALGFDAIFLRPISPYGFAVRTREALRYETAQFLEFYCRALDRILEINRQGIDFVEVYAQILLTKILTPFASGYVDLQSPAGLGIAVVAYNFDGDVYAGDEARMLAEMGDTSFRLGNVHENAYREIFGGRRLRNLVASSVAESLPGCHECAFVPYCGADPLFNYRTQGDIVGHRPTSAFCARNMGILRHLFHRLRHGEGEIRELFFSWASRVPLPGPPESSDLLEAIP